MELACRQAQICQILMELTPKIRWAAKPYLGLSIVRYGFTDPPGI